MSRVVYLHVGAPKTGTTYLQDRLALNRGALAERGVHYPLGVYASQFRAALDLIDDDWGGLRPEVVGEWDNLVGRVRRHDGSVIVSHEILAVARPEQVRRVMDDLGDAEVHLVYSARDLARQIPAEWQERLKHYSVPTFARYAERVRNGRRTGSPMWFWRAHGLPDVLSRWSSGLPPEQVHLVTVPQPGAPKNTLWRRYCEAFGIEPAWAPEESETANASIGAAEAMLLRRFNQRLKATGVGGEDYRKLVTEVVVQNTLAHRPKMTKVTLPPQHYDWAEEVASEWVEWIEGSGIHVVGDVADLHPVRPPEGKAWADPDVPRRPQLIDAALDAMVALAVEAAKRPDPDQELTSKLRLAARRLRGQ